MVKKLINSTIYKVHVRFQTKMEEIEVRRKLITFNDNPDSL